MWAIETRLRKEWCFLEIAGSHWRMSEGIVRGIAKSHRRAARGIGSSRWKSSRRARSLDVGRPNDTPPRSKGCSQIVNENLEKVEIVGFSSGNRLESGIVYHFVYNEWKS
jgi:hypothetical protein